MDKWIDELVDSWMDGLKDGWMDGLYYLIFHEKAMKMPCLPQWTCVYSASFLVAFVIAKPIKFLADSSSTVQWRIQDFSTGVGTTECSVRAVAAGCLNK